MIDKTQIQEKLKKFLNREPTASEISNGFGDQNIINSIIIDTLAEQDKTITELQTLLVKNGIK